MTERTQGWITSFSLHAIEAIIGRKAPFKILTGFVESLVMSPYLNCYTTTMEEEIAVCRTAAKKRLDYDDALQYYVAKKRGFSLMTLDKHFHKVKDIQIILPNQIASL